MSAELPAASTAAAPAPIPAPAPAPAPASASAAAPAAAPAAEQPQYHAPPKISALGGLNVSGAVPACFFVGNTSTRLADRGDGQKVAQSVLLRVRTALLVCRL
jgi:hypothetical protein